MKTIIVIASVLMTLAGVAQAAQATAPAAPASSASATYYYWLHPKLGMVKVDRATNAMITSRQVRAQTGQTGTPPAAAN